MEDDDNRSWLSFKTMSSGGSNYGDPENVDDEDFHDPAKGVSFASGKLQSPKNPFDPDDRHQAMRSRGEHSDGMQSDSEQPPPPKPSQHAPIHTPPHPSRTPPPPPDHGDLNEASGAGELVSTSVSLFAPNWWDRMGDGDASSPQLVKNQFSNASSVEQQRQEHQASTNEMLQDLYPNGAVHHVDPELRRTESAESDVLLQTATDELIMVINGINSTKNEDGGDRPSTLQPERDETKAMAMADRNPSAPAMSPTIEPPVDPPTLPPSMSPIMKRLNQLEEIMVGVKNSQLAPGKDQIDTKDAEVEIIDGDDDGDRPEWEGEEKKDKEMEREVEHEPDAEEKERKEKETRAALELLKAEVEELRNDNSEMKTELEETKALLESRRNSEAELQESQNALSQTKAMLADAQEKLEKLEEESKKMMDSADSALKEQLRLANESKAELEAMTSARVKSLTTSLELMETNLRENNEQLQRVQDRSQGEISYLMAQLTEKDSQISKLARRLTVAEVDSDWRRLLGASERGRRGRKGNIEDASGEAGDHGEEIAGRVDGGEGQEMGGRENDSVLALERELEAQRKDISRALRFNPDRSLSPPAKRGEGKLAAFVDPAVVGLPEKAGGQPERDDGTTAPIPPPGVDDAPSEVAKPRTTLTQSSKTRQQQQQRHFHSSGMKDLLSRPEDDSRTYGMPSKATDQRGLANSKRVGIKQPLDPGGGVAGTIENYAKIPQYKQVSELPAHLRGTGDTVHGVLTSELGARAGRANRKYIPPPTTDPEGGFQGVLEGVYATGEAIPNSQKGREGRLGRSRSPNSRRSPSPSRSHGQAANLSPKAAGAPAAGVQPPKEFTPFSNKPPGRFSLNRSSAPFATTETVAAVRSTVSAQESALMKMGMETTLLKAEMDKLSRGRKSAAAIRRMREVEEMMEGNGKEMSTLRRSLKEKKEALGLA